VRAWQLRGIGTSVWLLALGCENRYPIAATACDDWCFATQRRDCADDSPEGCVSACEQTGITRQNPECEALRLDLTACFRDAPAEQFSCVADQSQPADACLPERRRLLECSAPTIGASCFDDCQRTAAACGSNEWNCEQSCFDISARCFAQYGAMYQCKQSLPPDCAAPGEMRALEDIPCVGPILQVLACASGS
jgi:hypothetical protein